MTRRARQRLSEWIARGRDALEIETSTGASRQRPVVSQEPAFEFRPSLMRVLVLLRHKFLVDRIAWRLSCAAWASRQRLDQGGDKTPAHGGDRVCDGSQRRIVGIGQSPEAERTAHSGFSISSLRKVYSPSGIHCHLAVILI
jgi:hypothetical protein